MSISTGLLLLLSLLLSQLLLGYFCCQQCSVVESKDNQTKEDEMGEACSAHGGDEKYLQKFGCKV
jgi:hypothetical protein